MPCLLRHSSFLLDEEALQLGTAVHVAVALEYLRNRQMPQEPGGCGCSARNDSVATTFIDLSQKHQQAVEEAEIVIDLSQHETPGGAEEGGAGGQEAKDEL